MPHYILDKWSWETFLKNNQFDFDYDNLDKFASYFFFEIDQATDAQWPGPSEKKPVIMK